MAQQVDEGQRWEVVLYIADQEFEPVTRLWRHCTLAKKIFDQFKANERAGDPSVDGVVVPNELFDDFFKVRMLDKSKKDLRTLLLEDSLKCFNKKKLVQFYIYCFVNRGKREAAVMLLL